MTSYVGGFQTNINNILKHISIKNNISIDELNKKLNKIVLNNKNKFITLGTNNSIIDDNSYSDLLNNTYNKEDELDFMTAIIQLYSEYCNIHNLQQNDGYQTEIVRLKQELYDVTNQLSDLQQSLSDSQINDCENNIIELEKNILELETKIKQLENAKRLEETEHLKTKEKAVAAETEAEELRQKVIDAETEVKELQQKVIDAETEEVEVLRQKVEAAEAEADRLRKAADAAEAAKKEELRRQTEEVDRIAELAAEVEELRRKAVDSEAEIEELRKKAEEKQRKKAEELRKKAEEKQRKKAEELRQTEEEEEAEKQRKKAEEEEEEKQRKKEEEAEEEAEKPNDVNDFIYNTLIPEKEKLSNFEYILVNNDKVLNDKIKKQYKNYGENIRKENRDLYNAYEEYKSAYKIQKDLIKTSAEPTEGTEVEATEVEATKATAVTDFMNNDENLRNFIQKLKLNENEKNELNKFVTLENVNLNFNILVNKYKNIDNYLDNSGKIDKLYEDYTKNKQDKIDEIVVIDKIRKIKNKIFEIKEQIPEFEKLVKNNDIKNIKDSQLYKKIKKNIESLININNELYDNI